MAFWNEHAFADHTDQTLDGYFVSPVTNETYRLTWSERAIMHSLLRCWYATDDNPWGDPMGYAISRVMVSKMAGATISDKLWLVAIQNLESAGLLSVIREPGECHKVKLGRLIRCDQNECQIVLHYPRGYHLPKVSTTLPEVSPELAKGEQTPNLSPDNNNLNNPLITSKTLLGVQEVTEVADYLAGTTANPLAPSVEPPDDELKERLETLPSGWVEWVWIRARSKRFDKPSSGDLAHAEEVYKETGLDLEPNGTWRNGRANPRPAQATKQYN